MLNRVQVEQLLITPTLEKGGMYTPTAVVLLLGTMAQESAFGTYLKQAGKGPALGIYQMEPATHDDIVDNYLRYQRDLEQQLLRAFRWNRYDSERLIYDLQYATVFARLQYKRIKAPLPLPNDITKIAEYWKEYYNTDKGDGTVKQFIANFKKYVLTT